MANRNRNQADWNNRENRQGQNRWRQGQQNRFDQGTPYRENFDDYRNQYSERNQFGRDYMSNEPYRRNYSGGIQDSMRDQDFRRRGYYGLQEGRDDWQRTSADYGRQHEDWNQRNARDFDENDWNRNYGQNYFQSSGRDYDRDYGQNREFYGQNYDRDRYEGSRGAREHQPQQRFGGEDWNSHSGGHGAGEPWRGSANWGQGRYEGSFDRDRNRNQSRFGGRDWDRSDRQDWNRENERGRDDESLGDKIGRFFGVGPKGWKRSDDRVRDDVSERLEQDPRIDASNIEIQVREGEVTITGSVPDRWTKRLAEDVAEDCRGVKDVHNQLRVASEGSTGTGATTGTRAGVSSETTTPGKRSVA